MYGHVKDESDITLVTNKFVVGFKSKDWSRGHTSYEDLNVML